MLCMIMIMPGDCHVPCSLVFSLLSRLLRKQVNKMQRHWLVFVCLFVFFFFINMQIVKLFSNLMFVIVDVCHIYRKVHFFQRFYIDFI